MTENSLAAHSINVATDVGQPRVKTEHQEQNPAFHMSDRSPVSAILMASQGLQWQESGIRGHSKDGNLSTQISMWAS